MPKKQKNGLYRTKITVGVDGDGKKIYKYISGKTKAELEAARQEAIQHYIDGSALQQDRLFGDYATEWYSVHKAPNVSASTRQEYRYTLNKHILPVFGDRNLRAISPSDLQMFINRFAGVSQTKITMIVASLRGIFRSAYADRIVSRDPTEYLVKPYAAKPSEKRALTEEERNRIEYLCATHEQGRYLAVMYYLGVRPGEARGLQWGDIDWTRKTVHIQRDIDFKDKGKAGALKTSRSNRYLPLPDPLANILRPHRGLTSAYIMPGERSQGALSKTTSERLWVEYMHKCRMTIEVAEGASKFRDSDIRSKYTPIITPHALRHNYITMCWENGIDVYTTMKLAGHSSIKTTMDIYTHLSSAQLDHAAEQVQAMFSKSKVAQKLHSPDELTLK